MNYKIRKIEKNEIPVLEDFLYEAIFIPEGIEPPSKDIVKQPELQVYITEFGTRIGDYCLVAEVNNTIVGAIWVRIMNDYGHVDDEMPSFAISLYKEYRGYGIGTDMMKRMLFQLKQDGYTGASLAVQKENFAVKMYEDVGFHVIGENEEEYIMVCKF